MFAGSEQTHFVKSALNVGVLMVPVCVAISVPVGRSGLTGTEFPLLSTEA